MVEIQVGDEVYKIKTEEDMDDLKEVLMGEGLLGSPLICPVCNRPHKIKGVEGGFFFDGPITCVFGCSVFETKAQAVKSLRVLISHSSRRVTPRRTYTAGESVKLPNVPLDQMHIEKPIASTKKPNVSKEKIKPKGYNESDTTSKPIKGNESKSRINTSLSNESQDEINPNKCNESYNISNPGTLNESLDDINPNTTNESKESRNPNFLNESKKLRKPKKISESKQLRKPKSTNESVIKRKPKKRNETKKRKEYSSPVKKTMQFLVDKGYAPKEAAIFMNQKNLFTLQGKKWNEKKVIKYVTYHRLERSGNV